MTIYTLEKKAYHIREQVIKMLLAAKSGHAAGSLGVADIMTALYFRYLNHQPKKPDWEGRDRFILSCGHLVPVWYATLAEAGYFDQAQLTGLRQFGSKLQGHPKRGLLPGVENTGGPLGQGVSQAVGRALAARLLKAKYRIVCLMSDGEQQEGQVWEALMTASKYKLSNLTFIVDRNNIQIDGHTEDIMPLEPLRAKYEAFGLEVLEVDGHNIKAILDCLSQAEATYEKPTIIMAHTIAGKGVSFMEQEPNWHGRAPNKEEALRALQQLRTLEGRIEHD
ncbi:MAG: transketolase [bacterium]|nr:transketolase [bacterium]